MGSRRQHDMALYRRYERVRRQLGARPVVRSHECVRRFAEGAERTCLKTAIGSSRPWRTVCSRNSKLRVDGVDRALTRIDQGLAIGERDRRAFYRPVPPPPSRRNPAEARSGKPRARRGSLPDRHRHREAARRAQLRPARLPFARQALPIDRPPRRRPRRPRARARRLCADAGNAGDRGGAGAAGGAGGNGRGQGRGGAAAATDAVCRWPTATRSSPRAASARRKRPRLSPEPARRRPATRTRRSGWRPTTVCGPATSCAASCRR